MDQFSGETWGNLLRELARNSGDELAETWLGPLVPEQPAPDLIRIVAPTRFHAERVEKQYGGLFRELVKRQLGRDVQLEFVFSPAGGDSVTPAPDLFANRNRNGNATATAQHPVSNGLPDPPFDEYDTALARATRPAKEEPNRIPSGLYQRYTFDYFVVGKSNQFAHAASLGVAEHPGHAYNPLFIFGGSGLGKTHVMQAIGNRVLERSPEAVVHYTSAENFMNEMISAIQSGGMIGFRNKWRSRIDVLLVDDVHFLQGKESTQEEFFHTFNALHGGHKQIVMTSDRPPKEIPTLEERLVSRFEWGLVTDIQPPDLETRIAILRQKAIQDNLNIQDDVLEFIASHVRSNIRELEGSLIRLLAFSSLTSQEINLDLAHEVLKEILRQPSRVVTVERIQKVIADYHGIPEEAMKVKKRTSSLAYPRQIAMYLSRELTGLSLSEIGNRFGGRDHTTVMHAHEKIVRQREEDPETRRLLQKLSNTITDRE